MTNNEINVAIAEACGWKRELFKGTDGENYGEPFSEMRWYKNGEWMGGDEPPNYCTDLNAMHEAWLTLDDSHQHTFWGHLHAVLGGRETNFRAANATARQRAEAFLRTIGKWKGINEERADAAFSSPTITRE